MTDNQFDAIIARIDGLQAGMETGFAEVNNRLGILAIGQVNLFNVIIAHTTDPGAHRG